MKGHFFRTMTEVPLQLASEGKQLKIISRNSKHMSLWNEQGIFGGSMACQST